MGTIELGQEPRLWLWQGKVGSPRGLARALLWPLWQWRERTGMAMPLMKVTASPCLGMGPAGAGAVASGQPRQQRSREWISHEGPPVGRVTRWAALPGSPAWLLFR